MPGGPARIPQGWSSRKIGPCYDGPERAQRSPPALTAPAWTGCTPLRAAAHSGGRAGSGREGRGGGGGGGAPRGGGGAGGPGGPRGRGPRRRQRRGVPRGP